MIDIYKNSLKKLDALSLKYQKHHVTFSSINSLNKIY